MIPMTVCGTGSNEAWLTAAAIIGLAIALGWAVPRILGLRTGAALIVTVCAAAIMLPAAMFFGIWPFDLAWRQDCGATPDPNIEVYFAMLAWPIFVILAGWLLRPKGDSK